MKAIQVITISLSVIALIISILSVLFSYRQGKTQMKLSLYEKRMEVYGVINFIVTMIDRKYYFVLQKNDERINSLWNYKFLFDEKFYDELLNIGSQALILNNAYRRLDTATHLFIDNTRELVEIKHSHQLNPKHEIEYREKVANLDHKISSANQVIISAKASTKGVESWFKENVDIKELESKFKVILYLGEI